MNVAELIEVLKQRPADAPVYVWDSNWSYAELELVSEPAGDNQHIHTARRKLPTGAVVVWGKL